MKTRFAVIILLLFATTAAAQDVARMEAVIQANMKSDHFMGAVLVARGGDIILSKGYGSANLEWDVPNSPTTKFRLGSLTKQFTAASILLLEERGMLRIDDPLKKYMPDAPAAWDAITIYNLLTHTSGIFNFTNAPEYRSTQTLPTTVEKTIDLVRNRPLDFAPGEKMSYSNSGYLVLGYLIEKLSGESYATFVEKNLFAPLGMKDSGYDSNSAIIPKRAAGYLSGPKEMVNAPFVHMTIPHAAGALYSTTEDLLRWEQGLFGGKVLTPDSLKKMTTPFKMNYAFGLVVRQVKGRTEIWHSGGINGFNTSMGYFPDSKVVVIVLGNVNGRAPEQIGAALAALAHGDTVETK